MNIHEIMEQALSPLDCYYAHAPVKQRPDTYVAWFEVLGTPALHSSGERRRVEHMLQVDIYSQAPVEALTDTVLGLLKAGGFRVASWGPEDYEADTRYRHVPITVRYNTIDKEE